MSRCHAQLGGAWAILTYHGGHLMAYLAWKQTGIVLCYPSHDFKLTSTSCKVVFHIKVLQIEDNCNHCAVQLETLHNNQCTVVQFWVWQFMPGIAAHTDSERGGICARILEASTSSSVWNYDLSRSSAKEWSIRRRQATMLCLPYVLSFVLFVLNRQYCSRRGQCHLLFKKAATEKMGSVLSGSVAVTIIMFRGEGIASLLILKNF